jgi:hypothetical protein
MAINYYNLKNKGLSIFCFSGVRASFSCMERKGAFGYNETL